MKRELLYESPGKRIYRYIPLFLSGSGRKYSWWSLPLQERVRKRRMENRLLPGIPPALRRYLKDAVIHSEIVGSDHCPVELDKAALIIEGMYRRTGERQEGLCTIQSGLLTHGQSDAAWCHKSFRGYKFCCGGSR